MTPLFRAFADELEKVAKVVVVHHYNPHKGFVGFKPGDLASYRRREALAGCAHGDGSSLGRDKDGYFAYNHRSRTNSYPSPSEIPLSKIRFVGSTA